jgi:hypothetical protein
MIDAIPAVLYPNFQISDESQIPIPKFKILGLNISILNMGAYLGFGA